MFSLPDALQSRVDQAVSGLDTWLETMRQPGGYAGPISHWWENSLLYCGPMIDWRYEGILCGYVSLYRRTGDALWLDRALQAGEDAVRALLPTGNFRNSSFQQGPMEGGTPHESAVDVGLLELAALLKERSDPRWERYFQTAQRNMLAFQIGKLWNGKGFLDQPWNQTLVPNKNGTLIEALVLYESLSRQDMSLYIQGAASVILSAQEKSGPRAGGIVHLGTGKHRLAIGVYNARAISGLLRAYQRDPREEYLTAAAASIKFMTGLIAEDGVSFGRYPDGSLIANPRMIAGAGDVLRAFLLGVQFGLVNDSPILALLNVLIAAQYPIGGLPTAVGLVQRGARKPYLGLPDFRDVLPVVGWCDKAFRTLASLTKRYVATENMIFTNAPMHQVCHWKGKKCIYCEDDTVLSLSSEITKSYLYLWHKSEYYPSFMKL